MSNQDKKKDIMVTMCHLTARGEAIENYIRTTIRRTRRLLVLIYLTIPVALLIGAAAIARNQHLRLALALLLAAGNILMATMLRRQRKDLETSLRQAENTVVKINIAYLAAIAATTQQQKNDTRHDTGHATSRIDHRN